LSKDELIPEIRRRQASVSDEAVAERFDFECEKFGINPRDFDLTKVRQFHAAAEQRRIKEVLDEPDDENSD
jgi:hypothetical protein